MECYPATRVLACTGACWVSLQQGRKYETISLSVGAINTHSLSHNQTDHTINVHIVENLAGGDVRPPV